MRKLHPAVFRQLGILALITSWISTALCTASTTLTNSANCCLRRVHHRPRYFWITVATTFRVGGYGADCRLFILAHEAAVTFDIST